MMYCGSPVDAQHRLKIEERIKLSRVPHDTLPGSRTEKRDQHVFQVLPLRSCLDERLSSHPGRLNLLKDRRLFQRTRI